MMALAEFFGRGSFCNQGTGCKCVVKRDGAVKSAPYGGRGLPPSIVGCLACFLTSDFGRGTWG